MFISPPPPGPQADAFVGRRVYGGRASRAPAPSRAGKRNKRDPPTPLRPGLLLLKHNKHNACVKGQRSVCPCERRGGSTPTQPSPAKCSSFSTTTQKVHHVASHDDIRVMCQIRHIRRRAGLRELAWLATRACVMSPEIISAV